MDAKDRNASADKKNGAEEQKISELPARDQNTQSATSVKGGGGGVPGRLRQ